MPLTSLHLYLAYTILMHIDYLWHQSTCTMGGGGGGVTIMVPFKGIAGVIFA